MILDRAYQRFSCRVQATLCYLLSDMVVVPEFAYDSIHEIFVRNVRFVVSKVTDGRTDGRHPFG